MEQQAATNTFTGGMIMDIDDLNVANTNTVKALNATISSFNGHEGVIQNDSGNTFTGASLKEGFVPIGSVEYGGIVYIASIDVVGNEMCEIGCFPSPDYDHPNNHTLVYQYSPLKVGLSSGKDADLTTKFLNFSVEHPVNMLVQPSFDGSINLILNDGYSSPKIINSGFHVQNNNTYEIINRYGENNTNRYSLSDQNTFNLQTSLYRDCSKISKFEFKGLKIGGQLPVGNYVFYAVACDKDGNESNIICESGMIPVFLGTDGDPFSVNGGLENQLSDKIIQLELQNIDDAYKYIKLYYSKATASNNEFSNTLYYKINTFYEINTERKCAINITGFETTESVDSSAINLQYFNANTVKAQAINQNMLFLGNVSQTNSNADYPTLKELSLRFVPTINTSEHEVTLTASYTNAQNSYYNSTFIYNYTGYHDEEFYRFGIVYIKSDGQLTSVFDVLGINELTPTLGENTVSNFNSSVNKQLVKNLLDWLKTHDTYTVSNSINSNLRNETFNSKGVCRINANLDRLTRVIGIQFNATGTVLSDLEKLGIKGYFFVRQKRIPTILAQGFTTNICEEAYVPSITTEDEFGEESKYPRYNYESFVQGHFKSLGTKENYGDNFYPKLSSPEKATYALRNVYEPRLFSLTNNSRAYFDKRLLSEDAVTAYWKEIGFNFTSDQWWGGPDIQFYGPDDNPYKYAAIVSTNADGTKLDGTYYTDMYFFESWGENDYVNEQSTPLKDVILKLLENDNSHLQHLKSGLNNNSIETFKNIVDALENEWWKYNSEQDIYQGPYTYKDDDASVSVKHFFDKSIKNPILSFSAPAIALANGRLYFYYTNGPMYAEPYQSRYNSKANKWFNDYTLNDDNYINLALTRKNSNTATTESDIITENKGYDLQIPTYNGKFSYCEKGEDRLSYAINPMEYNAYGMFCPEYELNQPYYNNIFTGQKLVGRVITDQSRVSQQQQRHYTTGNTTINKGTLHDLYALGVPEGMSLKAIQHSEHDLGAQNYLYHKGITYFSSQAGNAQDASFKFAGPEFLAYSFPREDLAVNGIVSENEYYKTLINRPFNIIRGIFSPYVGLYPVSKDDASAVPEYDSRIVNIYIPNYSEAKFSDYAKIRYEDSSTYQAISDRFDIKQSPGVCYRGDCFINFYTHRVNRNFNDSSIPYNDTILDPKSFKTVFSDNFSSEYRKFNMASNSESSTNFNLGDLNAVKLGSWVTFPIRTSINTALRSEDGSNVSEKLECGHNRTFYPLYATDASGSNKIPESDAYNSAYSKSTGDKLYVNINQRVYNKEYYKNRILYSNVLQSDSLINGNRVFLSTHYKDYTDQYGEIVKILSLSSNLICVCEHGILLIPVNERALAAEGSGGNVYINTSNVLPDNPNILSDTYGSKWEDSVIQTPYGIFGIDADSKRIWKCDGEHVEIISEFKVQQFLNAYLQTTIGKNILTCNIKSHYNAQKNDVMFTLYDSEAKNYWNLCYNINQSNWITFYSWIPLLSENIGNCLITTPIYVLRDKCFNKLYKHGYSNRIPGDTPLPTYWYDEQHPFEFEFIVKDQVTYHKIFDNLQILSNNVPPESFHYDIIGDCFEFAKDKPNMYKRQELTKEVMAKLGGSSISYKSWNVRTQQNNKSTMFPLYYRRENQENKIYDFYKQLDNTSEYDYDALTGTEVIYHPELDTFHFCCHAKGVDVRENGGLLRGNMTYMEDIWKVQINPINLVQANEKSWNNGKIPIVLNGIKVTDNSQTEIPVSKLPYGYTAEDVFIWDISRRKEVKLKDKYIKIRIRYKGDRQALISAINTLYTISFA